MIESESDTKEYMNKIERTLTYLGELSVEAGLNSHAAIFYTLLGSFMGGPDEIDKLKTIMADYNMEALKRHMP